MSEEKTVTVRDLIRQINDAVQHMSKTNPHRKLLLHCGQAMLDLAQKQSIGTYSVTVPEETVQ